MKKVEAEEEKKEDKGYDSMNMHDLYNILPFGCRIIDIRSSEEYTKMHIYKKSNNVHLTNENVKQDHADYQDVKKNIKFLLSSKANRNPSRTKVKKTIIIVSDREYDKNESDIIYKFIHCMFTEIQAIDALTEKYRLCILSDSLDSFCKQYPFYCCSDNDNDDKNDVYYPNCILLDELYLGSGQQATNHVIVDNLRIEYIVNATKRFECKFKEKGVEYMHITVKDEENVKIDKYFEDVAKFIDSTQGKVLVHCEMGVSRSSSFVIAYLMKYKQMTLSEAYHHVQSCRPTIHPNNGFFKQLIQFEAKLYDGKTTENMIVRKINVDQKVANLKMGLIQAIAKKK